MKKKISKKPILKKRKKLKIILIGIIVFVIILTALLSSSFKSVETTEEGKIKITIESPLNQTYYTENIILKVSTSSNANWIVDSVDGVNNTVCYNCNSYSVYYLKFSKGAHTFTVYAADYENRITQAFAVFSVA